MNWGSTKVVEYLEPLMSKELLCKFPDNSAFDFDYSQSSIWSPLLPRAYSPMDLEKHSDFLTPKKLNYEMGFELGNQNNLRKVTSNIKKKIATTAFKVNLSVLKSKMKKKKKKKSKKIGSELSPTPIKDGCNPVTKKVWNKLLKAASKHFKKKKKDPTANVRLSNYLRDGNIC